MSVVTVSMPFVVRKRVSYPENSADPVDALLKSPLLSLTDIVDQVLVVNRSSEAVGVYGFGHPLRGMISKISEQFHSHQLTTISQAHASIAQSW